MNSYTADNQQQEALGQGDIAIIGMAGLFPAAPDISTFWQNIVNKVDAVSDPPPEAWDPDIFYSADSADNDRVYCKRGGFLGALAQFDPLKHGIMPSALPGTEPDQWLALEVARAALSDAGYTSDIPERHRTAIILGKGTYLNHGNFNVVQHGQVIDQTLAFLRQLHPEYTEADLQLLRTQLKKHLPPFNADTAPGLVPNVTVGRIANRLDLMGPSYTIDAACASSLVAVDIARRDLLTGRCDLALVGGIHVVTPVPVLMLFCQLGALSHRQEIRPFDKDADGTILSEGVGMAVLKRREDAERDGNRIYAIIKGVGVASDGRALSVLAPRVEGEELALRRAYEQAGVPAQTVGLIEAHGTATLVGDVTELQALTRVLGERQELLPSCAIGTVKSMIGHTMPAAGMAGLLKTALALYHKTLPPTLHVDQPSPRLEIDKTPFYINTEARPWIHGAAATPRRAGVNAFGFGGINAHVVLEEYPLADETTSLHHHLHWETEVCILQGESRDDLARQGKQLQQFLKEATDISLKDLAYTLNTQNATLNAASGVRLALVASSVQDLQQKLDRALARLGKPDCRSIKDANGMYFFDEPLGRAGKLAFLFPGEGSQYVNMVAELCFHFPRVRACFDEMDGVFEHHTRGYLPSDVIFPRPVFSAAEREEAERRLWQMDVAIEALVTANHALYTLLDDLGIRPDAILGHSTGEFSAMRAAGMLESERYEERLLELNQRYREVAARGGIPEAKLLAVGASREQVTPILIAINGDLYLAMENCPHQVVLAGSTEAIDQALRLATDRGFICELLRWDRAYHTPLYEAYAEVVREQMTTWITNLPRVPLYSCTTAAAYPADVDEVRRIAHDHWMRPVEFRQTIEAMYSDGVRLFVEVGPRGNLTAFVDDILRGRPYLAVPADTLRRSSITQLNHLLGLLAAHAIPMRLDQLYVRRAPRKVNLETPKDPFNEGKRPGVMIKLATGWPRFDISNETIAELRGANQGLAPSVSTVERDNRKVLLQRSDLVPDAPAVAESTISLKPEQQNGHRPMHTTTDAAASPPKPVSSEADQHVSIPGANEAPRVELKSRPPSASPTVVTSSSLSPTPFPAAEVTDVMSSYLQTMDQFLAVQQEVTQAFLQAGGQTIAPSASSPILSPPITSKDMLQHGSAAKPNPDVSPALSPATFDASTAPTAATAQTAEPSVPETNTARVGTQTSLFDADSLKQLLLGIVSDKTGYPSEMLNLDLDLEADLGIDSIKRVEILGAVQQESGIRLGEQMDAVSTRKTLQGVVDFLCERAAAEQTPKDDTIAQAKVAAFVKEVIPNFPFVQSIVAHTPGQELVARCEISLSSHPFLRDHSLGRDVSLMDPALTGLPVMPFTMSMEMLAEAASALMPGWCLVSMKEIRAYRWIALDKETITLQMTARRDSTTQEVLVQIHEIDTATTAATTPGPPIVEGITVFADNYPQAPQADTLTLHDGRPGKWATDELYQEAMFHGPAFQGVRSMDRVGDDGTEATLVKLPLKGLVSAAEDADFVIDPVLLDQPGQVVGFWAAQLLQHGYLVFPFRLEALHFFGSELEPHEEVTCQARIELIGEQQVRSDLDVVRRDGRIHIRFIGWWDRRFDLPRPFYRLLLSPHESVLGEPWPALESLWSEAQGLQVYRQSLTTFPEGLLTDHGGIWQRVLAHLVLSQRELELWRSLRMPEARRLEWLLGRVVAKDAVRQYLKHRSDLILNAADVEILPDKNGQPIVQGIWTADVVSVPILSISHAGGIAVAVVGDPEVVSGLGVDIEPADRSTEKLEELAFTDSEQRLLAVLREAEPHGWPLRFWCAKEAVAKALGQGMLGGPQALVVQAVDAQHGTVYIETQDERLRSVRASEEPALTALTAREGTLIVALAMCKKVVAYEEKP